MTPFIMPSGPDDRLRQHRLIVFPPQVTRSELAEARLDNATSIAVAPRVRANQSWGLYHGDDLLGVGLFRDGIEFRFADPGSKALVARVEHPNYGALVLAQCDLLVVDEEVEELAFLVQHSLDDEAEKWFRNVMSRRRGKLGWQKPLDKLLCGYLNHPVLRVRERALYLLTALYEQMMNGMARKFFGNDEGAVADAVQESMARFLINPGSFDVSQGFGPYIGTIMRNYCIDESQRRYRERTMEGSQMSERQELDPALQRFEEVDQLNHYRDLLKRAMDEGAVDDDDYAIIQARLAMDLSLIDVAGQFNLGPVGGGYQTRVAAARRRIARIVASLRRFGQIEIDGKEGEL